MTMPRYTDQATIMDMPIPDCFTNGAVKRVMFDGGYATFADAGKGASVQPYKFGGKELDAMYGLNIYDFHARTQTPDLARFTRPDPLAEKTPHLSPYLFCANDPINNIDPTGMEVWFNDFMYTPGCEYFGDDDFVRRSVQAMNIVYQSGGDKLIDDLVASESKYSYVPGEGDKSFTLGENYGNTTTTIGKELGRDTFISAIVHESMHVGQFLNGQGGRAIFNEVEAYAFTAIISLNSLQALGMDGFKTSVQVENRYGKSFETLQNGYNSESFTDAMFLFKRESRANNTGIYTAYPFMPNNRNLLHDNINSMLLKYSP